MASACAMLRARQSSNENACSAVEMVFAARRIQHNDPAACRCFDIDIIDAHAGAADDAQFFAAFKIFEVTFVWLRTISAAKSGMAAARSVSLNPVCTFTSSAPSRESSSMPRCEMESAMKTLGGVMRRSFKCFKHEVSSNDPADRFADNILAAQNW